MTKLPELVEVSSLQYVLRVVYVRKSNEEDDAQKEKSDEASQPK